MDQTVKPTPAPINASVTLPRVLLKNEPDVPGAPAGWSCVAAFGAAASSCRLAGDRRVSFDPAVAAVAPSAAQGAAAAPSANATHRVMAAARLINRLTWYLLIAWNGLRISRAIGRAAAIAVPRAPPILR